MHSAEVEKKTKYSDACQEGHMSFTHLVVSVDGMLAPEFANFLRRIGEALCTKWEKPYSKTRTQGPNGGVLAQTMIFYPREIVMDVLQ